MFLDFFFKLKDSKIPVSLNEFLTFLQALEFNFVQFDVNKFYYLARASLVKDEKLIDKFDIIFGEYFNSIEKIDIDDVITHKSGALIIKKRYLDFKEINKNIR